MLSVIFTLTLRTGSDPIWYDRVTLRRTTVPIFCLPCLRFRGEGWRSMLTACCGNGGGPGYPECGKRKGFVKKLWGWRAAGGVLRLLRTWVRKSLVAPAMAGVGACGPSDDPYAGVDVPCGDDAPAPDVRLAEVAAGNAADSALYGLCSPALLRCAGLTCAGSAALDVVAC